VFNISSLDLPSASGNNFKYLDLIPFLTIPVSITNTGKTASSYVLLGFLSGSFGPAPHPAKSLVAYTRLHDISPSSSQKGSLKLTLGSLARVNEKGDMVLYPGDYSLVVDIDRKAVWNFTLVGEMKVLDSWPQPPAKAVGQAMDAVINSGKVKSTHTEGFDGEVVFN
jgi:beta-D-xylosidase 4